MDRIEKALQKLSPKERTWVKEALLRLQASDLKHLNIKKLKGREDIFRVRKGDIRIVYRVSVENEIFLLLVERKSDTTYNF